MRSIGVVTTSRADYGIYVPLLRALEADPDLRLMVFAGGMHLSPEFGRTVEAIERDGFAVTERVEMLLSSDSPEGIAASMGIGVTGFARAFARNRPDLLVVLGDRFEMHAAALAALPFTLPVAHIHGGELTQGAIDDALRHSITKLSHLHFVATEAYRKRVVQLGEEPWRVTVSGALSLDNLHTADLLDTDAFAAQVGLPVGEPFLLVTFHPATLEYAEAGRQAAELTAALAGTCMPQLITLPNADTGGRSIITHLRDYVAAHPEARIVENLGTHLYFSAMGAAAAMVGNSSSGILEAPSFGLPVVNVGARQQGRVRAANVIDTGYERTEIAAGLGRALAPEFRASLAGLVNPYGDGHAAPRILARLKEVDLDQRLIVKVFHDLP